MKQLLILMLLFLSPTLLAQSISDSAWSGSIERNFGTDTIHIYSDKWVYHITITSRPREVSKHTGTRFKKEKERNDHAGWDDPHRETNVDYFDSIMGIDFFYTYHFLVYPFLRKRVSFGVDITTEFARIGKGIMIGTSTRQDVIKAYDIVLQNSDYTEEELKTEWLVFYFNKKGILTEITIVIPNRRKAKF